MRPNRLPHFLQGLQHVETFEKRKFLFIVKGKSHRLNTRFRAGSVVDLSHIMNEGYAPQNPEF